MSSVIPIRTVYLFLVWSIHTIGCYGCYHKITAPVGNVSSPNWPQYYPNSVKCVWQFTTTPGHIIKLEFSSFDLEPPNNKDNECTYDYVEIWDGGSNEAPSLGRYCGTKADKPVVTSGNKMYMTFSSDVSVQKRGFIAIHTTAPRPVKPEDDSKPRAIEPRQIQSVKRREAHSTLQEKQMEVLRKQSALMELSIQHLKFQLKSLKRQEQREKKREEQERVTNDLENKMLKMKTKYYETKSMNV